MVIIIITSTKNFPFSLEQHQLRPACSAFFQGFINDDTKMNLYYSNIDILRVVKI